MSQKNQANNRAAFLRLTTRATANEDSAKANGSYQNVGRRRQPKGKQIQGAITIAGPTGWLIATVRSVLGIDPDVPTYEPRK